MSRRILIVEDDAETADYLAKSLRQDGFTVEHVADGRDGLIMGSGSDFDLIVTDRMLPTMDGLSVVKALRAAGVETPVLILSALAQIDERVRPARRWRRLHHQAPSPIRRWPRGSRISCAVVQARRWRPNSGAET